MARPVRESRVKKASLSEVTDDLSRCLREAEAREVVITRHGKPAKNFRAKATPMSPAGHQSQRQRCAVTTQARRASGRHIPPHAHRR